MHWTLHQMDAFSFFIGAILAFAMVAFGWLIGKGIKADKKLKEKLKK